MNRGDEILKTAGDKRKTAHSLFSEACEITAKRNIRDPLSYINGIYNRWEAGGLADKPTHGNGAENIAGDLL